MGQLQLWCEIRCGADCKLWREILAWCIEERFARLAYLKHEALWEPLYSDPRFAER